MEMMKLTKTIKARYFDSCQKSPRPPLQGRATNPLHTMVYRLMGNDELSKGGVLVPP
jgi:hypothetical protein